LIFSAMPTYIICCPSVRLYLIDLPSPLLRAWRNSGRSAWLSMLPGSLEESPITLPDGSMIVMRVDEISPELWHKTLTAFSLRGRRSFMICFLIRWARASRSDAVCSRKKSRSELVAYNVMAPRDIIMSSRYEGKSCHINLFFFFTAHSLKRYPTPRTVSIYLPATPSFFRSPTICTSTARSVTK